MIYVHLQVYELGGSAQKTIRKLCQAVVGEPPGEAGKQTAVWDCVLTHKDHTGMRDLYNALYMYIQYTGRLSMQGIKCNATQKPNCNSGIPYGIIIFYIPASIRDYYHVLHTGEGAMD